MVESNKVLERLLDCQYIKPCELLICLLLFNYKVPIVDVTRRRILRGKVNKGKKCKDLATGDHSFIHWRL
jgi:hypothetical protein